MKLGHPSEVVIRATGKSLELDVKGKFEICEDCGIAKSIQKSLKKMVEDKDLNKGEKWHIDTSTFNEKTQGGAKHWLM